MYVYMVQYCPENYTNLDVRSKCDAMDKKTYLQNIPVQSHVTNQVYANIFCAICHAGHKTFKDQNVFRNSRPDIFELLNKDLKITI